MPESSLRVQLNIWMEALAMKLNLQGKNILEIGIAGDEKPSGSYKFFGQGNTWTTMDKEAKWEPDIVGDITKTDFKDNEFDLVIMTQVIEHIWDYKAALKEIRRITNSYAIVDSPFMYEFHQDVYRMNVPWQEFDDYRRFTPAGLRRELLEVGFKNIETTFSKEEVLCLAIK